MNKIALFKTQVHFVLMFLFMSVISLQCFSQGAAINTTGNSANSSAILDISSTDQGLLIPRMTTAERNAMSTPIANGLIIYNLDENCIEAYNVLKFRT